MKLTLSYNLRVYSNPSKLEDVRYSSNRYKTYTRHFMSMLHLNKNIKWISTKGMGALAHSAQKRAKWLTKGDFNSCPQIDFIICPAEIFKSRHSSFDYWINVISQWKNTVKIPAKSYGKLNQRLKDGWSLSKYCELFQKKGSDDWFVRVFVTKQVEKPKPNQKFLGVDVGIRHASSRSDNYLGKDLFPIIKLANKKQKSRSINKHKKKKVKTQVKQLLDIEVTRALRRSKALGTSIAIENPKALANLNMSKMGRWARCYFARRLQQRALEEKVWVTYVNPAYTSIQCSRCKTIDKRSRAKQVFQCTSCGNTVHADINAAKNIALKGKEKLSLFLD